jgi:hypothetical protein
MTRATVNELMPNPTDNSGHPNWAIIVVHGVGETQPGATVDAFLPALAVVNPSIEVSGVQQVRWLEEIPQARKRQIPKPIEAPSDQNRITLFPSHMRRVENGKVPGLVAEVYWADLSQVREGVFHLLWGIFVTIFGLHYVVDQAAAQPGVATRFLRYLLYLAGWLLRGPSQH